MPKLKCLLCHATMPRKRLVVVFNGTPGREVEEPFTLFVSKPLKLRLRPPSRPVVFRGDCSLLDVRIDVGIDPFKVVPNNALDVAKSENSSVVFASCDSFVELDQLRGLWRIRVRHTGQRNIQHHVLVDVLDLVQMLLLELPRVGREASRIEPFLFMLLPLAMNDRVAKVLYRQVIVEDLPIHLEPGV